MNALPNLSTRPKGTMMNFIAKEKNQIGQLDRLHAYKFPDKALGFFMASIDEKEALAPIPDQKESPQEFMERIGRGSEYKRWIKKRAPFDSAEGISSRGNEPPI